jgi:hypothetical protein
MSLLGLLSAQLFLRDRSRPGLGFAVSRHCVRNVGAAAE